MISRPLDNVVQGLRNLVAAEQLGHLPDGQLLEQFVARHDEAAFAALVHRHGGMVLGVCRRVLLHAEDAEDACQATFLLLVRRASAIRKRDSLASWLHGVAYRVASRLRAQMRRSRTDTDLNPPTAADPAADMTWRELQVLLDAELQRLPPRFREPLVLCYLEGKTRDEAAHDLHCALSTLKARLERGRSLLRSRLMRRGLTLPAALFGAALVPKTASALVVPPLLVVGTIKADVGLATGKVPAGFVAASVTALVEADLYAAGPTRLKAALALVLTLGLLGTGMGLTRDRAALEPESPPPVTEVSTAAPPPLDGDPLPPELALYPCVLPRRSGPRVRQ